MNNTFIVMGASNHSRTGDREVNDYYATEPRVVQELLDVEAFSKKILEPCCGKGHISEVLKQRGKEVTSTDLIDRGYGGVKDIFSYTHFKGDIITNPPYTKAKDFVEKCLDIVDEGSKVAVFLKLQFLEGVSRQELFKFAPPQHIYVCVRRANCAKGGRFDLYTSSAICYAWFVWQKGYKGEPTVRWIE